ncbi:hypothetical protein J3B02_000887 [Coemansia erecta]|nr:hypothetical protein J3B02_000887 [Coemansia erecta]
MTPAPSLFQSLPEHVIKIIIGFSLETYVNDFEMHPQSGLSIMHSCQRWRRVFKELTCTQLCLGYSEEEFSFKIDDSPCCLDEPRFPAEDYAKTFRIQFELSPHFYNTDKVDCFLRSDYANCVFVSARRLAIEYNETTYPDPNDIYFKTTQETKHALANLKAFLLQFKRNIPNISEITFDCCFDISEKINQKFIQAFDSLVSEVAAGIKNIGLNNKRDSAEFIYMDEHSFTELTHFQYCFFDEDPRGLEIIRRNSDTLQRLVVDSMPGIIIDQMLYWDNGDSVVYTCLSRLEFFYPLQQVVSNADDCSCHFPALKRLDVYGADPALSNAFFNGKNTLECLKLWDTYDNAQNISPKQQFKSSSFGNLMNLELHYKYNPEQGPYTVDLKPIERYSELVNGLINAAGRLSIFSLKSSRYEAKLTDILSATAAFANIQKLDFTMIGMLFNDLVSVIRNCPQLCTLHCLPINDHPSIDGYKDDGLVKHIETNMYPLCRYLASLSIVYEDCWRDHETYMAMALLVVGCPRLSTIDCGIGRICALQNGLRNMADLSVFSDYCDRLKRIVSTR